MFKGADTDQLRQVATGLDNAASTVEQLMAQLRSTSQSLVWTGTDADQFRSRVDDTDLAAGRSLRDLLTTQATFLRQQAESQDLTSATLEPSLSSFLGPITDFGPGTLLPGLLPGVLPGWGPGWRLPWQDPNWFDRFPEDRTWPLPWSNIEPFWDGMKHTWDYANDDLTGVDIPLWSTQHDAALAHWGSDGSTSLGALTLAGAGSVALMSATAGASTGLSIGKDGLTANASANAGAYLVDAKASGSAQLGIASVTGEARGFVGAEASGQASAHVGPDGASLSAGVDAFAGAKASATAGVDLGGVGAHGTAEAWAGVGLKADADLSVTADHVKIGVSAGAALGLGGSLEFEIDVKPKEIVSNVGHFLNPFD